MSPYLHYGQISSLRVALNVMGDTTPLLIKEAKLAKYEGRPTKQNSVDAFLEELIVRKELSDNFCYYNQNYKYLEGAKDWALKSLKQHTADTREYIYSLEQFESSSTLMMLLGMQLKANLLEPVKCMDICACTGLKKS